MSDVRHVDFIRQVLLDKSHGFWNVNSLFVWGSEWILDSSINLRRGHTLSVVGSANEPKPQYFFLREEKGKDILSVMNERGLPEDVDLKHGNAILYKYKNSSISILKDQEKSFCESHINYMYLVEYNKQLYIPYYYRLDDVYDMAYKKDKSKYGGFASEVPNDLAYILSYNYEKNEQEDEDNDAELMYLIDALCTAKFNDLAMHLDENVYTYEEALKYCYTNSDVPWTERKRLFELVKSVEEENHQKLSSVVQEEIWTDEQWDEFTNDVDDDYVDVPYWYEISRSANGNMVISVRSVEDKKQYQQIKLKVKKEFEGNEAALESALNHTCIALVFVNQCWFEAEYNDGYE